MRHFATAALAAVLVSCAFGSASAFTFGNIAGRWCGPTATVTFTRSTMTVVPKNHNPTVVFRIADYGYDNAMIHVSFIINDSQREFTFGEFSRSTMVMLFPNLVEYRRC